MPKDVSSAKVVAAMTAAAPEGRAFFSARQPTDDLATVEILVRAGFNVTDVGVTLTYGGQALDTHAADDLTIEAAGVNDAAEVADLAGRCFVYSRFHADRRVGAAYADSVKREWVRNSCRGRAAAVYIVRRSGDVAGFLAVMRRDDASGGRAVIDLVGVDRNHQGHGIGRALSRHFIREWHGRVDRLLVGTQATNIPALRLYQSLGFQVSETSYVLHAHLQDGKEAA